MNATTNTQFAVLVRPTTLMVLGRVMRAKRCVRVTADTEKKAINQVNRHLKGLGSQGEAFEALPCEALLQKAGA